METSRISSAGGSSRPPQPTFVQISPSSHLTFDGKGKPERMVKSNFTLKNLTDGYVIFKVKTTRPHSYCVRPNSGVLKAAETAQIEVIMQSFENLPEEAPKHKFQIQAARVDDEPDDVTTAWKQIDGTKASAVQDRRLKCEWRNVVLPDGRLFNEGGPAHPQPHIPRTQSPTSSSSTQRKQAQADAPVATTARRAAAAASEAAAKKTDADADKQAADSNKPTPSTTTSSSSSTAKPTSTSATSKPKDTTTAAGTTVAKKTPSTTTTPASSSSTSGAGADIAGKKGTIANLVLLLLAFVLGVLVGHYVF
ncbi:hypothetical protein PTSG_08329 [Salpingoeca rosetta]|uniref:MSP domain-containing protein n=1 Tax=Salpingoeca rosetta (strain ATCC 50818 / BSB-021) TaxID=946362 RepID=F2UJD7_SALR5|nr:uncharacterized protein PTSG_08329 [Salpingoeca rosetta]EGD77236.1 hypothetical protein PTSG_08329 [Salpingoeca rosetta]|eukprot:XP_004990580.1 hypothetical protein PTSG_08329 [Salpingoeca rosetta]